jgi:hypothetical protein
MQATVVALSGFLIATMDWDADLAAIVTCIRFLQTCFAIDKDPALAEVCVDAPFFHFHFRSFHGFVIEECRRRFRARRSDRRVWCTVCRC